MGVDEFISTYKSPLTEFCACIIDADGEVVTCDKGHLQTLQELYIQRTGEKELPKEASAMFWLIVRLQVVVVDYENQVYSENLSAEQKNALKVLKQKSLISMHLCNIHGNLG